MKPATGTQETGRHQRLIQNALHKGLSFALFREPGRAVTYISGNARTILNVEELIRSEEKGFLMAPFHPDLSTPTVWIPCEHLDQENDPSGDQTALPFYTGPSAIKSGYDSGRKAYEQLVNKAMHFIQSTGAQKIVSSRVIEVPRNPMASLPEMFFNLCSSYPKAFVSLVSSPLCGTWITASPELLMKQEENGQFETVALAATQPATDNLPEGKALWSAKEIEEQAMVCRHIINCFKAIRLREFEEDGPHTVTAGHLLHLKTTYKVDTQALQREHLMSVMLPLLHPTSAVCGMPQQTALEFLLREEGYSRRYYTGYLGPLNLAGRSALFVNLRCMQVQAGSWELFAGGGVTEASEVNKEWQETEYKLNTLRSLLP